MLNDGAGISEAGTVNRLVSAGYSDPNQMNAQQQDALNAMLAQKNKEMAANALNKALTQYHSDGAKEMVATQGPDAAAKLLFQLTSGGSGATNSVISADAGTENAPEQTSAPAQTETPAVDPRTVQSPEVQAQNEQIRKEAYKVVHPTTLWGKIINNIPILGQMIQQGALTNFEQALKIGGGDPQGEYYRAYTGLQQQMATGDKPIQPEDLAKMSQEQYVASVNATNDIMKTSQAVLNSTAPTIKALQETRGVLDPTKLIGMNTEQKAMLVTHAASAKMYANAAESLANLRANAPEFNKQGVVSKNSGSKPSKTGYKVVGVRD